jgi:sucrose-6-phosphate hydrolase SacC (GH32 family)
MRTVAKSVYSIDDQTQNQIVFYSRNGKRGKWQDSGETEREQGRECEHWEVADVASVVKQTVRKYTC